MSDSPLKFVGHDKSCVAVDQYDFSKDYFLPVKFRPIAERVPGLGKTQISLDGKWRIHPKPPKGFEAQAAEGPGWSDITVPGQWLQQGFDIPQDKIAGMARVFEVPKSWTGKRIILRFDAIHAGTTYWLNGKKLGYSENLFTPVELDITDAVVSGKQNRLVLAMKVMTTSEVASYSSRFAFHNLGGIDRSVRLFALPQAHISRLHYTTPLDKDYRDATLSLDVSIDNPGETAVSDLTLRVKLTNPRGKSVRIPADGFSVAAVKPGENRLSVQIPVANPLKWSAEKPNLYKLTMELFRAGKLTERVEQTVGFRQIEIKNKQIYLNGKLIKLTGTLHLEVNPLSGRAATAQYGEADAKLFKEANLNYIRTCCFPGTAEFYDACDRLGLYVECEAPFCWSSNKDYPGAAKYYLAAQAAMVEYHRNNPSIIIWSLENETHWGHCFAETFKLTRREDPSRFIVMNYGMGPGCDMQAWHYPAYPFENNAGITTAKVPTIFDEHIPSLVHLYPDEYDRNPGLDVLWPEGQNSPNSYVSQIHASRHVVGGAICAGGDEQFYFSDRSVKGYGEWGFFDVWRRKKSSWWNAKLSHSPVWIPARKVVFDPEMKTITILVENRYSFTNLNEVHCTWELEGKVNEFKLNLPPREKGKIEIPVSKDMKLGRILIFRFTGADGKLITAHGVKLATAEEIADKSIKPYVPPTPKAGCPKWTDDGKVIAIDGDNFRIKLERATGRLIGGDGSVPLLRWPTPFFNRAEALGMLCPQIPSGVPYEEYPDESTRKIESITAEKRGDALAIKVQDSYKDFKGYSEILIDKTGLAVISFDYTYSGKPFTAGETGLRFVFDKKCQEIRWRRDAEWDAYPEDNIGRPEGRANAHMDKKWGKVGFTPYLKKPAWPWEQDENRFGTRDFRSAKYHIYSAELFGPDKSGIGVTSNGTTTDVRANLSGEGVTFHILNGRKPALGLNGVFCLRNATPVKAGYELKGSFAIKLLAPKK